jgi:glycosyltransferase involved in cell wall biosynthesis
MITLHVIALPHTVTSTDYLSCAYTQKVRNFCRMMPPFGYNVIHYGTEGSEVACEHVTLITQGEQKMLSGGVDWKKDFLKIGWDSKLPIWTLHNYRAIQAIRRRKKPGDILCFIAGASQKSIADAMPDLRAVEWGIGYSGTFAPFRVFESYAWMHSVWAAQAGEASKGNGFNYDAVIPNSFDPAEFPMGKGDGKYLLYIGRMVQRKGVQVAVEAAAAAGVPLKMAGWGGELRDGRLHFDGASVDASNIEYLGVVGQQQRAELMGGAVACIVPTSYIEPFGGVNVEAQLCGTPAITTDWGGFTETVEHGVTGYRCHTMGEFVWAIRMAVELDRNAIRARAVRLYSLEAAGKQYDRYFRRIDDLNGKGWYTVRDQCEV